MDLNANTNNSTFNIDLQLKRLKSRSVLTVVPRLWDNWESDYDTPIGQTNNMEIENKFENFSLVDDIIMTRPLRPNCVPRLWDSWENGPIFRHC